MMSFYCSDMRYAFRKNKKVRSKEELLAGNHTFEDWYDETGRGCIFFALLGTFAISVMYGLLSLFLWHFQSYCNVKWVFENKPCNLMQDAIMNQLEAWNYDAKCFGDRVEGCQYKLSAISEGKLLAEHTTNYSTENDIQDLAFRFYQKGKHCVVLAQSASRPKLSTLFSDWGTNYCNLRNLVKGDKGDIGLDLRQYATPQSCPRHKQVLCLYEEPGLRFEPRPRMKTVYDSRGRLISVQEVYDND